MRKPKYYLKPWHMVYWHHYISKKAWKDIRKENNKPYWDKKGWYKVKEGLNTWYIKKEALTQRLFIEEKEANRHASAE